MSFKQCSRCKSMVAESKAFCPDCDAPMDAEQKPSGSFELDSLMKTQNLSSTTQFRLLEQLNLSSFFNYPRPNVKESNVVENEVEPIQSNGTEIQPKFVQNNQVNNLKETPNISPQPELKNFPEPPTENAPNTRKTFYIVGGIILVLLFFVIVIVATIFSIFYFNLR